MRFIVAVVIALIDIAITLKLFYRLDYKNKNSEFNIKQEIVMAVWLSFERRGFMPLTKAYFCMKWFYEEKQIAVVLLSIFVIVIICAISIDLIYSIIQVKQKRINAYDIMLQSDIGGKKTLSNIVLYSENVIFLLMVLFN